MKEKDKKVIEIERKRDVFLGKCHAFPQYIYPITTENVSQQIISSHLIGFVLDF